jgi:hypothetical protein
VPKRAVPRRRSRPHLRRDLAGLRQRGRPRLLLALDAHWHGRTASRVSAISADVALDERQPGHSAAHREQGRDVGAGRAAGHVGRCNSATSRRSTANRAGDPLDRQRRRPRACT